MHESLYAKPDLTKKARFQQDAEEERKDGIYENPDDPKIYSNVMVAVSEDLQKPTEDTFQGKDDKATTEKRNPCRTAAVCLGLLTLLLLAGITGLGIHYFQERGRLLQGNANLSSENYKLTQNSLNYFQDKTAWEVEKGRLLQGNANLSSENYNLTQRISQSEEESAHLQAVNSNFTNQRDELQKMLDERDCCLQNWKMFHNHCYFVSTSTKTWSESKKDCENRRADLVIITSDAEQDYIKGLKERVWIGLKWDGKGNNWKWVDDSPLTTGHWADHQPDNNGNGEDCVETYPPSFIWNDLACGKSRKWICEMEI